VASDEERVTSKPIEVKIFVDNSAVEIWEQGVYNSRLGM
jgi:hypothetical protein